MWEWLFILPVRMCVLKENGVSSENSIAYTFIDHYASPKIYTIMSHFQLLL